MNCTTCGADLPPDHFDRELTSLCDSCADQEAGAGPVDEPVTARLEYLRGQIEAEAISYGEIVELQSLAPHIDRGDVQLLEWAGVPEFEDEAGTGPIDETKEAA